MFERFTEDARKIIVLAQEEARALKHERTDVGHICLAMLRTQQYPAKEVRAQIERMIEGEGEVVCGMLPFTSRAKKVLELALREALVLGHNYVAPGHILLGITRLGMFDLFFVKDAQ